MSSNLLKTLSLKPGYELYKDEQEDGVYRSNMKNEDNFKYQMVFRKYDPSGEDYGDVSLFIHKKNGTKLEARVQQVKFANIYICVMHTKNTAIISRVNVASENGTIMLQYDKNIEENIPLSIIDTDKEEISYDNLERKYGAQSALDKFIKYQFKNN